MMISPQLEEALKSREVLRVQENGLDVRLYDTDQILVLGTVKKDGRTVREGKKRVTEELEIPAQATLDLRSREKSFYLDTRGIEYSGVIGGSIDNLPFFPEALALLEKAGVDLHKWENIQNDYRRSSPQRYPELSEFLNSLDVAFAARKWERHELAIRGFIPTLMGHGNMHPLALLHPRVMWAYVAGTVFPFERKDVFDFEKGQKSLEERSEYLAPEEVVSHGGNVVLIRPGGLASHRDERDHSYFEAHFFNPVNYQKFLDGQLTVESPLPSVRDWEFAVTYGRELGRSWLHFSADPFDGLRVRRQREGLLAQMKNDIYLTADDTLVSTLEKIAPLPL